MVIDDQLADFTAFTRQLSAEQGGELTLDDAYLRWRQVDPEEVKLLQQRLASLDAGERGVPAEEALTELREKLIAKHGG